jgi:hypothetical protein
MEIGGTDLLLDRGARQALPAADAARPMALMGRGSADREVFYRNCDAVRASGAATIRRGDPGDGSPAACFLDRSELENSSLA